MDDERGKAFFLELKARHVVALATNEIVVLPKLGAHPTDLEGSLNANDELRRANGLGQEIIASCSQRTVERINVAQCRQEDDGRVRAAGQATDPGTDREAVRTGHPNVEKNAVGVLDLKRSYPSLARRRSDDLVAFVLESRLGEGSILAVVVDHEDLGFQLTFLHRLPKRAEDTSGRPVKRAFLLRFRDQSRTYASEDYQEVLRDHGITCSVIKHRDHQIS